MRNIARRAAWELAANEILVKAKQKRKNRQAQYGYIRDEVKKFANQINSVERISCDGGNVRFVIRF